MPSREQLAQEIRTKLQSATGQQAAQLQSMLAQLQSEEPGESSAEPGTITSDLTQNERIGAAIHGWQIIHKNWARAWSDKDHERAVKDAEFIDNLAAERGITADELIAGAVQFEPSPVQKYLASLAPVEFPLKGFTVLSDGSKLMRWIPYAPILNSSKNENIIFAADETRLWQLAQIIFAPEPFPGTAGEMTRQGCAAIRADGEKRVTESIALLSGVWASKGIPVLSHKELKERLSVAHNLTAESAAWTAVQGV
jgi:hypothetical protein